MIDDSKDPQLLKDLKDNKEHIDAALAQVKDWTCAVDGGAHAGVITDILRENFKHVVAFEPGTGVLPLLRRRKAFWFNVELHECALGNDVGMRPFGHDGFHTNTRDWFLDPDPRHNKGEVPVVKLDKYRLDAVGLIKLDLEGGELPALKGAERTLRRCHPVVVVELNPTVLKRMGTDLEGKEVTDFMAELGYKVAWRNQRDAVFV